MNTLIHLVQRPKWLNSLTGKPLKESKKNKQRQVQMPQQLSRL